MNFFSRYTGLLLLYSIHKHPQSNFYFTTCIFKVTYFYSIQLLFMFLLSYRTIISLQIFIHTYFRFFSININTSQISYVPLPFYQYLHILKYLHSFSCLCLMFYQGTQIHLPTLASQHLCVTYNFSVYFPVKYNYLGL